MFIKLVGLCYAPDVVLFVVDFGRRDATMAEFRGTAPCTFLTVHEVCQLLNLPKNRVYDLAARGQIPHLRIGERQLRFIQEDLIVWARSGGTPRPEDAWPARPKFGCSQKDLKEAV